MADHIVPAPPVVAPPPPSAVGGQSSINFPNAQQATAAVVPHGLGAVPSAVVVTYDAANGPATASLTYGVTNVTATQFTVECWCSIVLNGALPFFWAAIR